MHFLVSWLFLCFFCILMDFACGFLIEPIFEALKILDQQVQDPHKFQTLTIRTFQCQTLAISIHWEPSHCQSIKSSTTFFCIIKLICIFLSKKKIVQKADKSFVRGLVACIWKVDRSMPRLVSCLLPWVGGRTSGGGRGGAKNKKRTIFDFFVVMKEKDNLFQTLAHTECVQAQNSWGHWSIW